MDLLRTYQWSNDAQSIQLVLSVCIASFCYLVLSTGLFRRTCNRLINSYLCWKHPIRSCTGNQTIPTCPYEWPNGQGDVAKFLEGEERRNEWEAKYNGGVYRIWNRTTPEVVLTRPEHLQVVFKDSHQHAKAVNNNTGWLLGELLGDCLGLISQEKWRILKTVTEGPFVQQATAACVSRIEERTKQHVETLRAQGRLSSTGFHPVDDLRLLPFWVVAELIYGPLGPELEATLEQIIPLRERLFHKAIMGGWLSFNWTRHLPTATKRDLTKFQKEWERFNTAAYERASKTQSGQTPPIVSMMAQVAKGTVSRRSVYQTLDEMLFANLDVTIGGLSWNLLFLAAAPSEQAALRAEIRDARAKEGNWHSYLQSSSTLLAACILESARLKPLAAFSVPQAAPTDRIVDEFVIPAGTNVIIDTHAINIKNPWWGTDATKYRPQRFLERGRGPTESRYHYWRFGFGPRQCLGKHVANLVIRCLLVELVESNRLDFADPEQGKEVWGRKQETWITQPDLKMLCRQP
ncbi:hypothetical protein PISL3812_09127 [Talaromyces islandicus]|uniref:Uncharacterized protein n=1 Tax=Talaromyces islandicus TaxID=28573 RepID=A0A0U1M9Q5_TALIS|nr:hypothetical protein PISL3812_09127 [Talaromyces islandicus]